MFKFELTDVVYFLKYEKIHTGVVIARKYSDRVENFNMYADGPQNDWIDNATGGAFTEIYIVHEKGGTNHCLDANKVFKNDSELIDSLY